MRILFLLLLLPFFAQGQIVDRFTRFPSCTTNYASSNAANICNEANATTGVTATGSVTVTSDATYADTGTYAVKVVRDVINGTVERSDWDVSAETGNGDSVTITVKYYIEASGGTAWVLRLPSTKGWVSTVDSSNFTENGGWLTATATGTTNSETVTFEIRSQTGGQLNDAVWIDSVEVTIN